MLAVTLEVVAKNEKNKRCFLIFQAGCAFPSPPSQLREVGAGKGLGLLALPCDSPVIFWWGHSVGDRWDLPMG